MDDIDGTLGRSLMIPMLSGYSKHCLLSAAGKAGASATIDH